MRAIRRFTVRTVLPAPLAPLGELASNLRWSWHKPTRDLFESMDPAAWVAVHREPGALLGALSTERLEALAADPRFVARVEACAEDLHTYLERPGWYATLGADAPATVAYFSMEFGITGALPQYSGGLGILAGDHLKSASDLAVPIVGVGLFYATGYFKQSLSRDGWQQETYPVLDPDGLPLSQLRETDGSAAKVSVDLPGGRRLWAQVWKAQVGRVPLLLLDSDVEENDDAARGSPTVSTAAAASTGCSRNSSAASAVCAPCACTPVSPGPRSRRFTTPTRATRGSCRWNGSASTSSVD